MEWTGSVAFQDRQISGVRRNVLRPVVILLEALRDCRHIPTGSEYAALVDTHIPPVCLSTSFLSSIIMPSITSPLSSFFSSSSRIRCLRLRRRGLLAVNGSGDIVLVLFADIGKLHRRSKAQFFSSINFIKSGTSSLSRIYRCTCLTTILLRSLPRSRWSVCLRPSGQSEKCGNPGVMSIKLHFQSFNRSLGGFLHAGSDCPRPSA